jgi:DNA-binding MarR family transcriptional regulator
VTRIYDAELREAGLRSTQLSLLGLLGRVGEVRQVDLGAMASLEETTLTRNLRPPERSGWVTILAGVDRRAKLVAITEAGKAKLE